uniref:PPC domain-containing DNA-binding protein n=1 Tax=Actinoplanes sp. CA-151224 TaxID=3239904 RepID=UPI003F491FB8
MIVLSVKPGEEVMDSLTRQLREQGIRSGAVVSLVGAVDSCGLSNMPADNAREDILTEYKQPLELSGTGEIADGKPHLHCVVSGEGNTAIGGHLHWARVETFFVNAYVLPLTA